MVKVSRKELSDALSFVGKAVQSRTTLPVLSCVKMTYSGDLVLESTNLSSSLWRVVQNPDEVMGEAWSTAVPYDKLKSVVGVDAGKEVELSLKGDVLTVVIGKQKAQIKCLPADEFPLIARDGFESVCFMDADRLKGCVDRVAYAAVTSKENQRLNAVYFDGLNSTLTLVARDQIVGMAMIDTLVAPTVAFEALIPLQSIPLLSALDGMVEIALKDGQISFATSETKITCQLVGEKYYEYRKYIPAKFVTTLTGQQSGIKQSLQVVSAFSKDDNNVCVLETRDGKVFVSSRGTEYGGSDSVVDCEIEGNDDFKYLLNAAHLIDVMGKASAHYTMSVANVSSGMAVVTSQPFDGWTAIFAFMNQK